MLNETNKTYSFYSSPYAYARPDTLGVFFETSDLKNFIEQKSQQIQELTNSSEHEVNAFDVLLPYEQVLAHEAFHIYQTLSCSIMSDFASAIRRLSRVQGKVVSKILSQNKRLPLSEEIMAHKFDDEEIQDYIRRVNKDIEIAYRIIDDKTSSSHVSLREIIEACAVSFQLISQHDYLGKKMPFSDSTYTIVWERFLKIISIDPSDPKAVFVARLVLLFTGDIYLKFVHSDFKDTKDFDEALQLIQHLVGAFPKYLEEFEGDKKMRDKLFTDAIEHVENNQDIINEILEYSGTLKKENQAKLYTFVRLYVDIFKRITISGATSRNRPNSNKNRAVNNKLKELFPHWLSDLSVPCILSSFQETSKFSTLWLNINEVTFMDEIEQSQFSLNEDNELLNFMHDFVTFIENPAAETKCCSHHGFVRELKRIKSCSQPDSLNNKCILAFGKPLGEII